MGIMRKNNHTVSEITGCHSNSAGEFNFRHRRIDYEQGRNT